MYLFISKKIIRRCLTDNYSSDVPDVLLVSAIKVFKKWFSSSSAITTLRYQALLLFFSGTLFLGTMFLPDRQM
jgi:hypothetical protein